ncbi:MAG: tetratricopeptide repeat protein [Bryobacterales bacterium]|nr:tetratricopeptide repeat protein [Bryobacterales bacterium]
MWKRRARKGWRRRVGTLLVAVLAAASVIPPVRSQTPAQPPLPAGSREAARRTDAVETDAVPIEELVARAESAEQANDLPEAARLYERILEQRPDWAAVKLNLGLVYHSQQRYLEAVRILSQVVEQEPELRSAMLFLGASYYSLDRYAEAVPMLERYLSLEPASDEARPFLAASYYALNEYQASALQYLRQISLTPGNAALYFHLGEAYSAMAAVLVRRLEDGSSDSAVASGNSGYYRILADVQQSLDEKKYALAESRLGEALALDPENSEGRLAYGYYRLANGDLAAAKTDFEAILGNEPGHCRALQGLVDVGMGLQDQAGLEEAVRRLLAVWPACLTFTVKDSDQELRTDFSGSDAARTKCRQAAARRSFPANAAGRVERTLVMTSCLEIQGAVPAATAALLSILPESPRDRYLSFQILLRLAQRAYRQSARLKPNSPLLAGLRAREFERQGNLESADAAHRNALLAAGSDPRSLMAYARFKARIGRADEAAPLLEQVLQASPHHPRANALLADVFLSLDRTADAIPLLRRAVGLNPGDEPSRRKLATALDESGQIDEAILVLESAPADSDGQIHFLLGNMYRRKGERQKAIDALRVYQQRRRPSESSQ